MPVCWQEERRRRGESPGSRRSWSLVRDPGSHEPHTKAGHRQTPMFSQGAEALSGTLTQSACETAIAHSGAIRMLPGTPDARLAHQCGMRNQTELQQGSWSTYSMRGTTVEWKDLHWWSTGYTFWPIAHVSLFGPRNRVDCAFRLRPKSKSATHSGLQPSRQKPELETEDRS